MNNIERDKTRKEKIQEMYTPDNNNSTSTSFADNKTISLGVMSGVSMALYLIVLELTMRESFGAIVYFQYLLLAAFIFLALRENEKARAAGRVFQRGLTIGIIVSAISGLLMVLTTLAFSVILPEYSLDQFGLADNNISRQIVTGFGMALETFVFGMILTFIFLQFMKKSSSSRPVES